MGPWGVLTDTDGANRIRFSKAIMAKDANMAEVLAIKEVFRICFSSS